MIPAHPQQISQTIIQLAEAGRAFAVATVLRTQGSCPCKAGSRAVFAAEGLLAGTIGGGLVEAEAQRLAGQTLASGRPVVFDFALHGDGGSVQQAICGGGMRVLVDPTAARQRAALGAAAAALEQRRRGLQLTWIAPGEVTVEFVPDGDPLPVREDLPDLPAWQTVLQRQQPQWFELPHKQQQSREVLLEPLVPPPRLLIVGGGHVGRAVAVQADLVGFELAVIDDRAEFADPARFPPGTEIRCGSPDQELTRFPIDPDTYIVLMTRGHRQDGEALAACLRSPAAFLGMIGSRRKVAVLRKQLLESGQASVDELGRVLAPIGLDIGAVSVPEIATSIVAQLIAARRGKLASCRSLTL